MSRQFFIDISIGLSVFLLLFAGMPAMAGDAMVITSETLMADQDTNIAVFEGSVVARSGNIVLSAERMTANYGDGGALKNLVAEGLVKLVKGLQVLTSNKAVYDVALRRMDFTGEPRAVEEGNVLMGSRISYFIDEDRIKVDRSTVIIEDQKTGTGGAGE